MTILESLLFVFKEHPLVVSFGVTLCFLHYIISHLFNKTPQGVDPFSEDCRRPVEPLVYDQKLRDKVIKQGFTKKKIPENVDVIVIGSGIASMTSAALLAKAGNKVLVLEQHDQAGGCCHSFVENGIEFDTGIHYVGNMQLQSRGRTVFDQISEGQLQWAPMSQNFDTVAVGKPEEARRYPLMSEKDALKQSIIDNFPDEVESVNKFFAVLHKVKRAWQCGTLLKILPKWLCKWVVKMRLLNIFVSYGKYSEVSTQEFLDSITNNDDLKTVLSYIAVDYGTLPGFSSLMVHYMIVEHFMERSSYPVGGSSEVAMRIIPVIEKANGSVLVRAPVTDIIIENGRAVGVRVKKGDEIIEIRCETVLSGCGIPNTLSLLPKEAADMTGLPELLDKGLLRPGMAGVSLFICLDGTTESLNLPATNLFAFTSGDWNAAVTKYLETGPELVGEEDFPVIFVGFHSAKDPTWAQRFPGKSACSAFTFCKWEWFKEWENKKVKHRGTEYESLKEYFAQQMWSLVCKHYPQLKNKATHIELGSPVTNNYYIRATAGEFYGLDHNTTRFSPEVSLKIRPDCGIPGLYLTGQDIVITGMTGAMTSAIITVSHMLNRNLFNSIRKLKKKLEENGTQVVQDGGNTAHNGLYKSKSS